MKPNDLIQSIGIALLIVGCVTGLALQSNLWDASTIYSDTTDPIIKEAASTHGSVTAPDNLKPTVLCFIDENMELDRVTAELRSKNWLGQYSNIVETIELVQDSRTGSIYKYRGTFSETLEINKEYRLIYEAKDKVARTDLFTTSLKLIELTGTVWVNEVQVISPDQTIYLASNIISIIVDVNQDADDIQNVFILLNGEQVKVLEYRFNSHDYFTSYQLPSDGKYGFTVQVLSDDGSDVQLASFSIDLGSSNSPMLLAGAIVAIIVVSVVLFIQQRNEDTRNEEA
ncbi:MAG: hypothetical protein HN929_02290 [Chloroflexi bacterium]|nr:hypothetical protein [Chloroflexota bacterium]